MLAQRLETYHKTHYRGDDAHGIDHSRRVLKIALNISEGTSASKDAIAICSFFHDLVSFKKGNMTASRRAKSEVKKVLSDFFELYPELQPHQDVVFDCVDAHSFSERTIPIYIEGKIIQDADKIDALGFIGIARAFMVAGKIGSKMVDYRDPFATDRKLDDREFAVDHFFKKLASLPNEMNTKLGAEIAKARWGEMNRFLKGLEIELRDPIESF